MSPLTTRTSTDTAEFPASCTRAANKVAPVFDDRDGDRLTITMSYTIPDNVFVVDEPELVQPSAPDDLNNGGELKRTGKLFFSGQAAREQTDVRIDLTATDPSGATASTHVLFRVFDPGAGTSAPSLPAVAAKRVELHERASIKLPAATGGDVMVETASGDDTELVGGDAVGTRTVFYDYRYAASGLPAGLAFDADTRTISGTPTATGSFTVTYTAEDADGTLTDADKASRTFTLEVFDDTAPALQSATVNGANLVLTYDETLAGSAPPAAAFAVTVAGANRGVSSVSLSGSAVTLTLASAVAAGQIVAVSYTAANAGAQPIRDAAGNNSADLTSRAVESGSAGARNFADAGLGNGAPNTPSSATATPGPGAGGITVTWTHATTGPAAVRWKVEARPAGTTSWSGLAGVRHQDHHGRGREHLHVRGHVVERGRALRPTNHHLRERVGHFSEPVAVGAQRPGGWRPADAPDGDGGGRAAGVGLQQGADRSGATGASVRGDGGRVDPEHKQHPARRWHRGADAGLGGGQDRHGDGELHGGQCGGRAAAGRGRQQGGGPQPPGGDGRRHDGAGAPARGGTRQRVGAGLRRGAEDRGLGRALLREHQGGRGRPERHGCQGPRGHAQLRLPHAGLAGDRGPGRAGELQQDEAGPFFTDPGPGRQRGGGLARPTGEERSHAAVAVDGGGGGDVAGADLRRGACGFGAGRPQRSR